MGSYKIYLCKPVVVVLVRVYHMPFWDLAGWEDIGNSVLPKRQICKYCKYNGTEYCIKFWNNLAYFADLFAATHMYTARTYFF